MRPALIDRERPTFKPGATVVAEARHAADGLAAVAGKVALRVGARAQAIAFEPGAIALLAPRVGAAALRVIAGARRRCGTSTTAMKRCMKLLPTSSTAAWPDCWTTVGRACRCDRARRRQRDQGPPRTGPAASSPSAATAQQQQSAHSTARSRAAGDSRAPIRPRSLCGRIVPNASSAQQKRSQRQAHSPTDVIVAIAPHRQRAVRLDCRVRTIGALVGHRSGSGVGDATRPSATSRSACG